MAQKYIGITIGPIFDTINLTSSPAALWAASYMFSSLTKNICEVLTEEYGVKEEQIVSPYYKKGDELLTKNNGVGLFHDRIIFNKGDFDASQMSEVREKALQKISEYFGIDFGYLNECVMVSSVEFEAANPILASARILDSLELAKPFVFKENKNPILALFNNEGSQSKNEAVKAVIGKLGDFQLIKKDMNGNVLKNKDGNVLLKSISDITMTGSGYKKYKYYAIVRSDGDNMSKIIASLETDGQINEFSKDCLKYCSDIAELVAKYNGVAIYSGGDDLLAIVPCTDKESRTPFDFIAEANGIFNEAFDKYQKETSLSFGITMAYYKFPLYEALEDSADLLFGVAKKHKNCSAVRLQKHSGQSEGLLISNEKIETFACFLSEVTSEESEILLSAMHKLNLFKESFESANDTATIKNLFINTFDSGFHKGNSFVHKTLPEMLESLKNGANIFALEGNGAQKNNVVLTMNYMLRMLKFFVEKDGGKE